MSSVKYYNHIRMITHVLIYEYASCTCMHINFSILTHKATASVDWKEKLPVKTHSFLYDFEPTSLCSES